MSSSWTLLLAALLLASAAEAVPTLPQRYASLDDAAREVLVQQARLVEPLARRLDLLTQPFLGTPYVVSPLGEGEGVDADPRLRFDAVDCLTFVETAIALAAGENPAQRLAVLDDVRYGALPPSFVNRNHFMEAQWIPNNLLKGYLRDLGREVAGERLVEATKEFSPARWKARRNPEDLPLTVDQVPRGLFHLSVVPLDVVAEHPERIPSGTLLVVVRKELYTHPTRVTHTGLVLTRGGMQYVRHASKKPYLRVIDEPLAKFVERNQRYDKWPVEGFALYEIRVPTARVAQLAHTPDAISGTR